jgi:hypothetical protein
MKKLFITNKYRSVALALAAFDESTWVAQSLRL